VFGKKFQEYVQFQRWILILIAVVFLLRLGLSLAGVPVSQARWVSINLVLLVGLMYCSVAVHTRGFGSYKQLFGLLFVQTAFAHALIAAGIILGIVTGIDNIYTAPEFFGGSSGRNWMHVIAHVLGMVVLPIFAWLVGSVILFLAKRIKSSARP
jgi:hypothetical protein